MYDITQRCSFESVNYEYDRIVRTKEEIPPIVLVGYK